MINFLYVFLGGGLGSICRYALARWMVHHKLDFPLATFLANVAACFVLGYLVALHDHKELHSAFRMLFMTGFCGGFSTFSTFTAEAHHLFQAGAYGLGLLYVGASLLVCLLSLYAGLRLAGL